jgi:hypothetical protein
MIGSSEMYDALNNTDITDLLTTYGTRKAIFEDLLVPEDVPATATTINYYRISSLDGGLDYTQVDWSVNCRANTYNASLALAQKVFEETNRINGTNADYHILCRILQTIPPLDATDNYNTPIAATLKTR